MQFVNLNAQYQILKQYINKSILNTISKSQFIQGENTKKLELILNNQLNTNSTLCSSGTNALIIAMLALDINTNDQIIIPSFTFKATSQAIELIGAKPIFTDINENNFCINPNNIENKINKYTKAIIITSIFGNTPNMNKIKKIADKYSIPIIEDAAQNFANIYKNTLANSHANITTTSFYPSKTLSAYGNAGAIFTNNKNILKKINDIINLKHKKSINAKIDEIQASILIAKLKTLNNEIKQRYILAQNYNQQLSNIDKLILPQINPGTSIYSLRYPKRQIILNTLKKHNIPYKIYYQKPLHQVYNIKNELFPITTKISKQIFSLPLCPYLDTQNKIISLIQKTLQNTR